MGATGPARSECRQSSTSHLLQRLHKYEIGVTLLSSIVTPPSVTFAQARCHLAETTAGTKETGKETTETETEVVIPAVLEVEAARDTETNRDGDQVVRVVHAVRIDEVLSCISVPSLQLTSM
jgi:hypothetical protein